MPTQARRPPRGTGKRWPGRPPRGPGYRPGIPIVSFGQAPRTLDPTPGRENRVAIGPMAPASPARVDDPDPGRPPELPERHHQGPVRARPGPPGHPVPATRVGHDSRETHPLTGSVARTTFGYVTLNRSDFLETVSLRRRSSPRGGSPSETPSHAAGRESRRLPSDVLHFTTSIWLRSSITISTSGGVPQPR